MGRFSEFLTLQVDAVSAVPLDLAGAESVAITWLGQAADTGLAIAHQREFAINADPAFVIQNMATDGGGGVAIEPGGQPFVFNASDARLWICATNGGAGTCHVWITRCVYE